MSKKNMVSRRELLERWRAIEEEEDDYTNNPPDRGRLHVKEHWFSDAFNYLISLPKENHIWCGSWDLMGPLLETFYNYFKDEREESPLKLLWKRVSEELQQCMHCVCQHHQAIEMYNMEYESDSIGPLLDVLRSLDEERVANHLKEVNAKIAKGEFDPETDITKVVTVLYEVLMFPVLLDDQYLLSEFQIFIEAIDESHELTLSDHQQYPGVYALLFVKSRRTRSIGFRFAQGMGKLRRATDLEPLHTLLKKCIGLLETEGLSSTTEKSRPRMQLDRITVWLGIKALLGFLEPPTFEEGILERYPNFLNIVLNNICDDSPEFSHAVNCLRLLFEMLGCKLWLRSALSPSVMRDTLLGQCFHTQNEKSHKDIFDLFQPFLQSLEALQDGEHEKQRRHFIYFLLHQVTVSSNFSTLMRKKACQIALFIVHRGYKMNPSCPPFECAHMWGPSLVSSLKDSSLHISLRQPAFDLIETILVSDAAAIVTSVLNYRMSETTDGGIHTVFRDEDDEELFLTQDGEQNISCWNDFNLQNQISMREYEWWMCIPMLWFEVLVEIDPLSLPISFSKAVYWALSRFPMVAHHTSSEMSLPFRNWLSTFAQPILHLFVWKMPSGADDGGAGIESKNSVKVSTACMPLVRIFKRLTSHFVVRMEQAELLKQWTWEPRMSESVILSLVDPDDNARQVGRRILEQVSNTRGLLCGLQFLCSSMASLSATYVGIKHALKLVQLDSVLLQFRSLHHFFFVLYKLLKEGVKPIENLSQRSSDDPSNLKLSSQGGFLRQPIFDSLADSNDNSLKVDPSFWEKFNILISEIAWPSFCKCFVAGKAFIDDRTSQMTCIRLLEILPAVLQNLGSSICKKSGSSVTVVETQMAFTWLHDIIDWGKSSLPVVLRYWKQAVLSILSLLKETCGENSTLAIRTMEELVLRDDIAMDELTEQVSHLRVSMMDETSHIVQKTRVFPQMENTLAQDADSTSLVDATAQILYSTNPVNAEERDTVIVLSDDEMDTRNSINDVTSNPGLSYLIVDGEAVGSDSSERSLDGQVTRNNVSIFGSKALNQTHEPTLEFAHREVDSDRNLARRDIPVAVGTKHVDGSRKENSMPSQRKPSLKNSLDEGIGKKTVASFPPHSASILKKASDAADASKNREKKVAHKVLGATDMVLKELVWDAEADPWEFALKSARGQSHMLKPNTNGPKRKVIQLNMPVENRFSNRLVEGCQRFKPPRLDDWYKPILEIDYFGAVGLAPAGGLETPAIRKLKEVPVCFQSPDDYVAIFRPLVLEEFNAQLHSSFTEMVSLEEMSCGSLSVLSVERVDDFHILRCVHDDTDIVGSKSCVENDLILLTRQPIRTSSHDVHMVGKVESREKDNKRKSSILVIKFYLQNGCSRLNRARKLLLERSKWYISRLMSITPQLREFQALSSINNIPLCPTILSPSDRPLGREESRKDLSRLSPPLQQILKSSYNDSQLQAVRAAAGSVIVRKDYQLSLIQGPPGTGKTRTIVAIISVLLALSGKSSGKMLSNDDLKPRGNLLPNTKRMNQSAAIARAWQDAALARQLNEDESKTDNTRDKHTTGRVLVCAQSNAAVDELVSRITSNGLYGSDGTMYKPYLVRVGNAKTVHPNSLPFFIDTLVDHRLSEEKTKDMKNDINEDSSTVIRSNLEKLVDRIRYYEAKRANLRNRNPDLLSSAEKNDPEGNDANGMSDAEIEARLRKLYGDKKAVYNDLSIAQAREKKANEESKNAKYKLRKSILKEAQIVVTTLSGCGGDLYRVCSESFSSHKFNNSSEDTLFDAVVIDEAAQALEPATLIPLQLLKSKGSRCIMVGDPKQLPATVISNVASKYLFQCSMFERLQKAGYPVTMLAEQFRMHPEISRFPSLHFYENKLLNGGPTSDKEGSFHKTAALGPYVFFDIVDGQELRGKNAGALSLYNDSEADAAVELLRFFKKSYPSEFVGGRIGIITPYKSQLSVLRSRFSSAFGSWIMDEIEFNTVDGFQGREVDILIVSTVRASEPLSGVSTLKSSSIGFVADVRRMNVALTRARLSLWILGNARTLQTNENWRALVKDAEQRKLIISVKKPYASLFTLDGHQNQVSSSYHGNSRGLKDLQMEEGSRCAEQQLKLPHNSSGRKRSHTGEYSTHLVGRVERTSLVSTENDKAKKKAKHQPDLLAKKHHESVAANSFKRTIKDVKSRSAIDKTRDDESHRTGSGKRQLNKGNADADTNAGFQNRPNILDRTGQALSGGTPAKLVVDKDSAPLCTDDSAGNTDIRKHSVRNSQAGDTGRSSNQLGKSMDNVSKRKQQREAVDALLSSALISSKKSESSSKSVPAKMPTNSSGPTVRPPKPRKGQRG